MAGLWTLTPSIVVRLHVPELFYSLRSGKQVYLIKLNSLEGSYYE
jgi:hypothetical protein